MRRLQVSSLEGSAGVGGGGNRRRSSGSKVAGKTERKRPAGKMVGANVKQGTMALMEQLRGIEEEAEAIASRLRGANGPGLTGSLIDRDGFPRADVDVPRVRADRQRLAMLRNDHKDISSKIEQNLHVLHAGASLRDLSLPQKRSADGEESRPRRALTVAQSSEPRVENGANEGDHMEEDTELRVPFAVFDEVTAGSPAEHDGIRVGDLLVKFGSVAGGDNLLPRLAMEGQNHRGSPIEVMVLRGGDPVILTLTPREWSGRGLVGCHVRPL